VAATTRVHDLPTGFFDGGTGSVKKLLILILLVLGGLAVWRKVAAQRADLDLWSEATTPDDY
jgi:hypothetical protein